MTEKRPYRRHVERAPGPNPNLSYTQGLVLQALADGVPLERIATKLRLNASYDAIRNQAHFIRIKLGATTSAHAVAIGFRKGLVR